MRLLLLSNSTMHGTPYLEFPKPFIKDFLADSAKNIVFIPFAGVSFSFDEYEAKVKDQIEPMGHRVTSIHHFEDYKKAILEADCVMVGGGNTWHLTRLLHQHELIEPIRERVQNDGIPYIGWSAGSNVACPTLKTTNDMPIVDPLSFETLNLVPFQINAHYTELTLEGHGGETRQMRLGEFIIANPDTYVLGLPEGTMIRVEGDKYELLGIESPKCKLFKFGQEEQELTDLSGLTF